VQAVFQSVADRDGMIQSGAEEGMNESYERLDELLKEQREGQRHEKTPMQQAAT
ncbi:ATPase, partial [Candidatus Bathyarchaeota archaeon]